MSNLKKIMEEFDEIFSYIINEPIRDWKDRALTQPAIHELLRRSGYYAYRNFIEEKIKEIESKTFKTMNKKTTPSVYFFCDKCDEMFRKYNPEWICPKCMQFKMNILKATLYNSFLRN